MPVPDPGSVQTRPSLLLRLKAGDHSDSWRKFYRVYGKLVRDFAIRAGLTHSEADEVVQETAIAVARHLPEFHYNPEVCRFKTWLLNQTRWRIHDQWRKRRKTQQPMHVSCEPADAADSSGNVAEVADSACSDLEAVFEAEWREHLLNTALGNLSARFSFKQLQVFDLVVRKGWPAPQAARSLGMSLANVYVTKFRIAAALKEEICRLERGPE